ncbi:MAG: hypothetical protein ACE5SW_12525 [Nitrososphaeraceae archaeon]
MNLKQETTILKLFNPEYDTDKMILKYDITVDNTTSIELPDEFGQITLVFDVKNTLTNKITKTIPIEY